MNSTTNLMNATTSFDPLNVTAAALMILNGTFGLGCNSLIVYIFAKAPSQRTSFNLICIFRAIGNCFILAFAFLGMFVPMSLLDDLFFSPSYQTIIITSVNSIYTGLQFSGIFIAINRFCAMYFSQFYSTLFSIKSTLVIMTAWFGYRIARIIIECTWNIPRECFTTFSPLYLSWVPNTEEVCQSASTTIVDASAVILGLQMALNLATFIKIFRFYKSTEMEERDARRSLRKNKVLFIQTVCQDFTYLIDMLFTYQLNGLIEQRYWTFISGTLVWQSVHSFDGLIMIMFNERLTFLKKSCFPHSSNPSVMSHPKMNVSVIPSRNLVPVSCQ